MGIQFTAEGLYPPSSIYSADGEAAILFASISIDYGFLVTFSAAPSSVALLGIGS